MNLRYSMFYNELLKQNDIVVQMARCSYDVHIQETIGTLLAGATLVMLHPGGNMDLDYLANIFLHKQITSISTVPSLFYSFFTFLKENNRIDAIKYFRSVSTGGMYSLYLNVMSEFSYCFMYRRALFY